MNLGIVVNFYIISEELVKEKPSKRFIRQGENSGYLVVSWFDGLGTPPHMIML